LADFVVFTESVFCFCWDYIMIAKQPFSSLLPVDVKNPLFRPKSLLSLSISLLIWQSQCWADPVPTALPELNEESTPKVGFDTQVEGNQLTINQTANKVILNWDSFDIGAKSAVHFQQAGNGIALNRILDQSPSQIFGSLTATGSIYLLNPNGVLFGQGSQVHVGNLLVSTLGVDQERFVASNIFKAVQDGEPALEAPNQAQGSIIVEKGAHISTDSGGSVLVFAPEVTNAGTIRTPDGQTVLAAAQDKVYLTTSDKDPDLRGVFVEVGTGGDVTNLGEIVAERGNVTLAGLAVNQDGRVRATSSVEVNGSIRLLARDGAKPGLQKEGAPALFGADSVAELPSVDRDNWALPNRAGDLSLGQDSLTQVSLEQPPQAVLADEGTFGAAALAQLKALPGSRDVTLNDSSGNTFKGVAVTPSAYAQWREEQSNPLRLVPVLSAEGYIEQLAVDRLQGASSVDASAQSPGRIALYGESIEIGKNALVSAKGGAISVLATDGKSIKSEILDKAHPGNSSARVQVAEGAVLDVSGYDVDLPMSRNSLEVEVRGNEVRDQPLQRDGVLRGQKVRVDARLGTKMLDIQGTQEKLARKVDERLSEAGSLTIFSEGLVDLDPASQVNIKGGLVRYAPGELVTTGLIKDGAVVDISQADPNRVYEGLTELRRQEAGYTEVQDAGKVSLLARNLQWDAALLAGQPLGERQLLQKTVPSQGSLTFNLSHFDKATPQTLWLSPVAPSNLDATRESWLNPSLINAARLSELSVYLRGEFIQERGADLALAEAGRFSLSAQDILLAGNISAAGGEINLATVVPTTESTDIKLKNNPLRVLPGARLDVSGNWVNRSPEVPGPQARSVLDGGSISLTSKGDLRLETGASLAANAGGLLDANNRFTGGKGGSIHLSASLPVPAEAPVLLQNAELSAQGFSQNGRLSVKLPALQLGAGAPLQKDLAAQTWGYDFFAAGRFAEYSFTTERGGADILPQAGTGFTWQQRNWLLNSAANLAPSARSIAPLVSTGLLPDYLRKPTNLKITQVIPDSQAVVAKSQGYIHLADGVDWLFDPQSSFSLTGLGRLYVGGSLALPGGKINLQLDKIENKVFYDSSAVLWLGDAAWLSVAGTTRALPGDPTLSLVQLVDAGAITVDMNIGRLVTEEGSGLDLSAAVATADVLTAQGYQRQTRSSHAGSLNLQLADGMIWQSHVAAASDASLGARGASLEVVLKSLRGLGPELASELSQFPALPRGLDLYSQRYQNLLEGATFGQALPTQVAGIDGEPLQTYGRAILFADDLNRWGLDSLTLDTRSVEFSGDTKVPTYSDLSLHGDFTLAARSQITLDTQDLRLDANTYASFTAPWISLGERSLGRLTTNSPLDNPVKPTGLLRFEARELDLAGNLLVRGAADTALFSQGALLAYSKLVNERENPVVLSSDGNLSLIASVVYPGSLSHVTLESTAPDGVVEIASNGQPVPRVLSAGGQVDIKAPQVVVSGALSAPLGQVTVDASSRIRFTPDGKLSVSAKGSLIPLGTVIGSDLSWEYKLLPTASGVLIDNSPAKRVSLNSARISLAEGSQIDVSGGGDILGYQFTPGPTGSRDILTTSSPTEGFALLPYNNVYAHDSALASSDLLRGTRITLGANALLPAGDYTLLPSRYALLPGAVWVKPTGTLQDPTQSQRLPDGGLLVAGKLGLAHTQRSDADWRGYTLYPSLYDGTAGEVLAPNGQARYQLRQSDSFFSRREATALLPHALDGGQLVLNARESLSLSSGINGQAAAGEMAARLDIAGNNMQLVSASTPGTGATPGTEAANGSGLRLLDTDLAKLSQLSTLVGGRRDDKTPGKLTPDASSITVEAGVNLSLPEITLVAKDSIRVKAGASLAATGSSASPTAPAARLQLSEPGALLRLSGSAAELAPSVGASGSDKSRLLLESGASLKAQHLLAASSQTQLNSTLAINPGGGLSLVGENIQLGGTAPVASPSWAYFADGFFSNLGLQNLSLVARNTLRLTEGTSLSAQTLRLGAREITRGEAAASNSSAAQNPTNTPAVPAKAVTLEATQLQLEGASASTATTAAPAAAKGSALNLKARNLVLGGAASQGQSQALSLQGFESVSLQGSESLRGQGTTALDTAGDLRLSGPLSTLGLANLAITSGGTLSTEGAGVISNPGLGGSVRLQGKSLQLGGQVHVASGQLSLTAEQDLTLLAGGVLDVAGISRTLGKTVLTTPGGQISLTSLTGAISTDSSSQIRFGASGDSRVGGLQLRAQQGSLNLAGDLNGRSPGTEGGGQLLLDAKNLGDITGLTQRISNAFSASNTRTQIDLRQRQGDLLLAPGTQITGNRISLTADAGSITAQGSLTSALSNGQITLNARNGINLGAEASISANRLQLASLTGTINSAANTQLRLGESQGNGKPGQLIFSAGQEGLKASRFLARQQGYDWRPELWWRQDLLAAGPDDTLAGASNASGQGDANPGEASFTQAHLQAATEAAEALLAGNPTLLADLAPGHQGDGLRLHAEFYSAGDLRVTNDTSNSDNPQNGINLWQWRLAASSADKPALAGTLSLRAGGHLYVDESISDGFKPDESPWGAKFFDDNGLPLEALMSAPSSHINLVAGADLTSSNRLATLSHQGTAGSLFLADGKTLRTGTGDLNLATQGDLRMGDPTSSTPGTASIYTAGATRLRTYAGSEEALPDYGTLHPYSASQEVPGSTFTDKIYYPEAGGDIAITTGGGIQGSNSTQLVNEWLHRAAGLFDQVQDPVAFLDNNGGENTIVSRAITTWGIAFQNFSQGIASLGGGNLRIHSGGEINRLSVSAANTGKAQGEGLTNRVEQSTSGALEVFAAGDINSARWYSANNSLDVTSLGSMGAAPDGLATVLALGDATARLTAAGDLQLATVFNPTQLPMAVEQFGSTRALAEENLSSYMGQRNFFSTYGERSQLQAASLGGDVQWLASNFDAVGKQSYLGDIEAKGLFVDDNAKNAGINLLPAKLSLLSHQGDIHLSGNLTLAPEKGGFFDLVAERSIVANTSPSIGLQINQLNLAPETLGTLDKPLSASLLGEKFEGTFKSLWVETSRAIPLTNAASNDPAAQSSRSVFAGDSRNNLLWANQGDILGNYALKVRSAKGLDVTAGRDLLDTTLVFHHKDASHSSSIHTGRDLVFSDVRSGNGALNPQTNDGILVLGPGSLRIEAGRHLALGATAGIQSLGRGEVVDRLSQFNPYLPDKAADLYIAAGLSKTPDYAAVISKYLGSSSQTGSFIDQLDSANPQQLLAYANLYLPEPAKTLAQARSQLSRLPLWQQQQVALGALRLPNSAAAPNYSRELLAYVTSPVFDPAALRRATNQALGLELTTAIEVQNRLAQLPISQQHSIALAALGDGKSVAAKNFLDTLVLSEIRQGGETAIKQGLKRADPEGYERGYKALATLFPGISADKNPWAGNLTMDNSRIRTSAEADVNILLPGGSLEVGLESPTLNVKDGGLILESYGDVQVAAAGSINVNRSRIFNLSGGDVMLWSSYGDVDAGKGAKTALSVPPPRIEIDENGLPRLVFPPAIAGSGIQASNPAPSSDPRTALTDGADVMLFAPAGVVDAGDAGISSTGNILVGALEFVGRDNVAGNVTISVSTDTAVAVPSGAGAVGNDAAQSAEKAAENATNDQKQEKKLAYLTIELLGSSEDDDEEDEEEEKKRSKSRVQ
jgi:filamentous hemagglutinin